MGNEEIDPGPPHLLDRPLDRCPTCESAQLVPVADGANVNWLCVECSRCWHVELGHVWRVDPGTCDRCDNHKHCARVYAEDHAI